MEVRRRQILAGVMGVAVTAALGGCRGPAPSAPRRRLALPTPRARPRVREAPVRRSRPFVLDARFSRAIRFFGGRVDHPHNFPASVAGFQQFLTASGVRHFRADELTTPHHPDLARWFGHDVLLPPRQWWPRGAALALLGEDLRAAVGRPIRVRNWWRPHGYNEAVDGDSQGDHPTAHAIDFDYNSPIRRDMAERRLLRLFYDQPWLQMSLGLGRMTTHVGLLSPLGCRVWVYPGHPAHDGKHWRLQPTTLSCLAERPT